MSREKILLDKRDFRGIIAHESIINVFYEMVKIGRANIDGGIIRETRRSLSDWTNISASGRFTRITFQAEGDLGSTHNSFYGADTGGYPDTYVMNESNLQRLTGVSVIPEPASMLLFGDGLMGMLGILKEKLSKKFL